MQQSFIYLELRRRIWKSSEGIDWEHRACFTTEKERVTCWLKHTFGHQGGKLEAASMNAFILLLHAPRTFCLRHSQTPNIVTTRHYTEANKRTSSRPMTNTISVTDLTESSTKVHWCCRRLFASFNTNIHFVLTTLTHSLRSLAVPRLLRHSPASGSLGQVWWRRVITITIAPVSISEDLVCSWATSPACHRSDGRLISVDWNLTAGLDHRLEIL